MVWWFPLLHNSKVYPQSSQTCKMELLVKKCETNYKFSQKAPSWPFDWGLHTNLQYHATESEFRFCGDSKPARNVPVGGIVRASDTGPSCVMINDIIIISDSNYIFKVSNRNIRTRCEICSKLTIKTPERRQNGF